MLSFAVAEWLASLITKQEVFCSSLASEVNLRGVLVLLICVQIFVRFDCFSHSITIEVWKTCPVKNSQNSPKRAHPREPKSANKSVHSGFETQSRRQKQGYWWPHVFQKVLK